MCRVHNLFILLISAFMLLSQTALGQKPSAGSAEERSFNRQQFSGWGGIVFRCLPNNLSDSLEKRICKSASSDARFLAESAKIPFQDTGSEDYSAVLIASNALSHALVLETSVLSTKLYPKGVHVAVRAGSFYSGAIELGAIPGTPESTGRDGDLILWERSAIGTGDENGLAQSMPGYVSTVLKEFFALFLKSRS